MRDSQFYKQAELMLRLIPHVSLENDFVLKGGTALNFFLLDMPRLSVDIDLCFSPVLARVDTFTAIDDGISRIIERVNRSFPGCSIFRKQLRENISPSFILNYQDTIVKLETNFNIRGFVYPPKERELCNSARESFKLYSKIKTSSIPDLYGGKICAALDRQHPRDLFDIWQLLKGNGFTAEIRQAFIVYLISHNRPMVELLNPSLSDITQYYKNEFVGMTEEVCTQSDLEHARIELVQWLKSSLTESERQFILSIKEGKPQWDLMPGIPHLQDLPSVQWKLLNLNRMKPSKHKAAIEKLKRTLEL